MSRDLRRPDPAAIDLASAVPCGAREDYPPSVVLMIDDRPSFSNDTPVRILVTDFDTGDAPVYFHTAVPPRGENWTPGQLYDVNTPDTPFDAFRDTRMGLTVDDGRDGVPVFVVVVLEHPHHGKRRIQYTFDGVVTSDGLYADGELIGGERSC